MTRSRKRVLAGSLLALGAALALIASACGATSESGPQSEAAFGGAVGAPEPSRVESKASLVGRDTVSQAEDLPERVIIRNGEISLVVQDLDAAVEAATSLATELGGFVVSSNRYGQEDSAFARVAIRVPAESFDEALTRLRSLATRVESESTTTQDVTEEFIDLEARLRTMRATEERLVTLFERADNVEEVIQVQRELSSVRSDIERTQGRLQFLERSAAMSLITVSLRPVASPAPLVNPQWDFLETVKNAFRGLVDASQGIATLAIWVAVFAPFWLVPLVLLVWAIRRAARGGRRQPYPPASPPP